MRTKMMILALMVCLALIPVVPFVANIAFGYGGGGSGALPPPVTPVTPPVTPVTPPTVTITPPTVTPTATASIEQMTSEAAKIIAGTVAAKDAAAEAMYKTKIVNKITAGASSTVVQLVTNFVTYGTDSTKALGAGERAGVVNSFKAAFGKLPAAATEWNDVIKIGNGRWPSQTSSKAEAAAKIAFKKVYVRDANMANKNDNAAVTVMAYGLRPASRNLNSEKAAINSFKAIYKKAPALATDWDTVRAIAYSGAKR